MSGCLSYAPTGDLAHNPGMCPDWELNQWPFGFQAGAQSTEPPARAYLLEFWKGFPCNHTSAPIFVNTVLIKLSI